MNLFTQVTYDQVFAVVVLLFFALSIWGILSGKLTKLKFWGTEMEATQSKSELTQKSSDSEAKIDFGDHNKFENSNFGNIVGGNQRISPEKSDSLDKSTKTTKSK